jgi:bifunctional DNase/RNase
MLVKVTVGSLGLDRSDNTPVMILREEDGDRILPIWIGPGEASAIAIQMANMTLQRPVTHDLLVTIIGAFGGQLTKIAIDRREEGTYYAELFLGRDQRRFTLDARPSDSVALALRTGAEILVAEELLVPKEAVRGPRSTDPSDPSRSDRPESPPALS